MQSWVKRIRKILDKPRYTKILARKGQNVSLKLINLLNFSLSSHFTVWRLHFLDFIPTYFNKNKKMKIFFVTFNFYFDFHFCQLQHQIEATATACRSGVFHETCNCLSCYFCFSRQRENCNSLNFACFGCLFKWWTPCIAVFYCEDSKPKLASVNVKT